MDYSSDNWRAVRNRSCIKAIMILLGVLGIQMLVAILYMGGMLLWQQGVQGKSLFDGSITGIFEDRSQLTIILSCLSAMISGIWCGVLYARSNWRVKQFDYHQAFSETKILAIVGIGVGSCVVITMLLSILYSVFPAVFDSYNQVIEILTADSILTVFYTVCLGPVSEELIFRGAIFDRLYLAFPFWIANFLQAMLFAVFHGNIIQGLYALLIGFLFGMIKQATGSIYGSIAAHILFNTTSYLLGMWEAEGMISIGITVVCVIMCLIGLIRSILFLRIQCREKENVEK